MLSHVTTVIFLQYYDLICILNDSLYYSDIYYLYSKYRIYNKYETKITIDTSENTVLWKTTSQRQKLLYTFHGALKRTAPHLLQCIYGYTDIGIGDIGIEHVSTC